MKHISITLISPTTREKTIVTAYSRDQAKSIIKTTIEHDNKRVKLDSAIVEKLAYELREEYENTIGK